VQPFFVAQKDRVRIILAVVAALAAILLPHRRHHPPPQRTAVRELHALGEWQALVVPRRRAVIAVVEWAFRRLLLHAGHHRCGSFRRQCGHGVIERQQAGEKAVKPIALLGRERRIIGQDARERRRRGRAHSTASAENSALRASTSCRLAKARKLSAGVARWARYAPSMRATVAGASSAFTSR